MDAGAGAVDDAEAETEVEPRSDEDATERRGWLSLPPVNEGELCSSTLLRPTGAAGAGTSGSARLGKGAELRLACRLAETDPVDEAMDWRGGLSRLPSDEND